ncbi:hypothetical protein O77CONTIG1_00186 [Leptolyngbya sp. O-77]|nr:hypothetical protein O77CONTIG1_00186 [Leptolyngbya sp. O-77]
MEKVSRYSKTEGMLGWLGVWGDRHVPPYRSRSAISISQRDYPRRLIRISIVVSIIQIAQRLSLFQNLLKIIGLDDLCDFLGPPRLVDLNFELL